MKKKARMVAMKIPTIGSSPETPELIERLTKSGAIPSTQKKGPSYGVTDIIRA